MTTSRHVGGLALHRQHPRLEMRGQFVGNPAQPFFGTDKRLNGRPFALQALLLADGLVSGQLLDFGINLAFFGIGQLDQC